MGWEIGRRALDHEAEAGVRPEVLVWREPHEAEVLESGAQLVAEGGDDHSRGLVRFPS